MSLENPMPTPPAHPYEVTIKIGGETWDYVLRAVADLARHIPAHGPDCKMLSGGGGGSHYVDVQLRDVTPEQFRKELFAFTGIPE